MYCHEIKTDRHMSDALFFKQKTAYELRISDWSSDVCSSDLESRFRRTVVSSAGAYGLMQVRPGTARDIARWDGDKIKAALSDLKTPAVNMDLGQRYLPYPSRESATGGLLPKVIAASNAPPAPLPPWEPQTENHRVRKAGGT